MMNLHQLRLFCEVVRQGSFTRAAQANFISQSALSAQVRRLERSVGRPLFARVHGKVTLTPAGHRLAQIAERLLAQEAAVEACVREMCAEAEQVVFLGVSPTGALYPVLDALREFRALHPQIDIRLQVEPAARLFERLLAGTMDVAVAWDPIEQPAFDAQPLGASDYFVIAGAASALRSSSVLPAARFLEEPFIALSGYPGARNFVEHVLRHEGLLPRSVTHLPSIDTIKRAVEAGLGLGLLSEISVRREVGAGQLVALRLEGFELRRRIVLIRPRDGWRSPAARRLTDFLTESPFFSQAATPAAEPPAVIAAGPGYAEAPATG